MIPVLFYYHVWRQHSHPASKLCQPAKELGPINKYHNALLMARLKRISLVHRISSKYSTLQKSVIEKMVEIRAEISLF